MIVRQYGNAVRVRSENTEHLVVEVLKDGAWAADRTWDCRSDDYAHTNAADYAIGKWQLISRSVEQKHSGVEQ